MWINLFAGTFSFIFDSQSCESIWRLIRNWPKLRWNLRCESTWIHPWVRLFEAESVYKNATKQGSQQPGKPGKPGKSLEFMRPGKSLEKAWNSFENLENLETLFLRTLLCRDLRIQASHCPRRPDVQDYPDFWLYFDYIGASKLLRADKSLPLNPSFSSTVSIPG